MKDNDICFIRITEPAFQRLKNDYERMQKTDAKNYGLAHSKFYQVRPENSDVSLRVECNQMYICAWDDKLPDNYIRINIKDMEFYVEPDFRYVLSTSTIDLLNIFSSDGVHSRYEYILQDSSNIKTEYIHIKDQQTDGLN